MQDYGLAGVLGQRQEHMMKSILRMAICTALLVAGLCGCKKVDESKLEGTTYSVGSWGVDYRHFVRVR